MVRSAGPWARLARGTIPARKIVAQRRSARCGPQHRSEVQQKKRLMLHRVRPGILVIGGFGPAVDAVHRL